jgi:hypothetical protein
MNLSGCNAGACTRCRGMLGVRIQSALCGDQTVSTHPRPRCQGQCTRPAPCRSPLIWAGRGHNRTWCPGWAAAAGPIPLAPSGTRSCRAHAPSEAPPAGCTALAVDVCIYEARCACCTALAPAASCAQGLGRQSVGAMFVASF